MFSLVLILQHAFMIEYLFLPNRLKLILELKSTLLGGSLSLSYWGLGVVTSDTAKLCDAIVMYIPSYIYFLMCKAPSLAGFKSRYEEA